MGPEHFRCVPRISTSFTILFPTESLRIERHSFPQTYIRTLKNRKHLPSLLPTRSNTSDHCSLRLFACESSWNHTNLLLDYSFNIRVPNAPTLLIPLRYLWSKVRVPDTRKHTRDRPAHTLCRRVPRSIRQLHADETTTSSSMYNRPLIKIGIDFSCTRKGLHQLCRYPSKT